jgi:hypothetical protein
MATCSASWPTTRYFSVAVLYGRNGGEVVEFIGVNRALVATVRWRFLIYPMVRAKMPNASPVTMTKVVALKILLELTCGLLSL